MYDDDSAITSFTIGTVKQEVHTLSSKGLDSMYVQDVDGSRVVFYIDQANKVIFNPDSLPMGVRVSRILCTIGTKNGGVVMLKSLTSDSLSVFAGADSVDFSAPREIVVYSNSGNASRRYTVQVNVHKQPSDAMSWNSGVINVPELAALKGMKGVACGGNVYLFGTDGTAAKLYKASESNARKWAEVTPATALDKDVYTQIAVLDGTMYAYSGGKLLSSKDGMAWQTVSAEPMKKLLGASKVRLYALTEDGKIKSSSDQGVTWTADALDTSAALLPTDNVNFACLPMLTDPNAYRLVLAGTSADGTRVWGKIEENDRYAEPQPWSYYDLMDGNAGSLPNLSGLQMIAYDGALLAFGGAGMSPTVAQPFANFWQSNDGGLSWKAAKAIVKPAGFDDKAGAFAMLCDANNYIWLACGGTAQVWHGRINRLGWAQPQTYFTE